MISLINNNVTEKLRRPQFPFLHIETSNRTSTSIIGIDAFIALLMIVRNHTFCIRLHFKFSRFCSSVCTQQIDKLIKSHDCYILIQSSQNRKKIDEPKIDSSA